MAIEEIERLKEKVDRDPHSKLFVPLAEEYKKIGMLDKAIETLIKGLERYPSYMSARVSLGKIYLDKGMLDKAGAEFEKVVSTIPDNLYAHKKLAEIYGALSMREKAIEELKMVLKLNPLDLDAEKNLSIIEGGVTVRPEITETVETIVKKEKTAEVPTSEPSKELGEALLEGKEIEETSFEEKMPERVPLTSEETFEVPDFTMDEINEALEKGISEESQIDLTLADSYISQGRYGDALNLYKKLLSIEPDNVHVIQRLEELKTLLELLGKGKEDLISKMNSFLDGIKRRRDEFFKTLQ